MSRRSLALGREPLDWVKVDQGGEETVDLALVAQTIAGA
jgi:hypothetical protein